MPFSGHVRTEWLDDGMRMRLLEPVSYTDGNGREWTAQAGFVTDGASIPRSLWSLIGAPYNGRYRVAAVLHDAAYSMPGIPKDQADLMLRDAAIELGAPHWVAEALYAGVRVGGASPYANDQFEPASKLIIKS